MQILKQFVNKKFVDMILPKQKLICLHKWFQVW